LVVVGLSLWLSFAEGFAGVGGEFEAGEGVAGDGHAAAVEQVVAADAEAYEEVEVGGSAEGPSDGVVDF
jgi:hypothetical protein